MRDGLRRRARWRVFGDPRWLKRLPSGVEACPVAPRPWRQGLPSKASGAVALTRIDAPSGAVSITGRSISIADSLDVSGRDGAEIGRAHV
mgnify:CR=1 FL=1